MIERLVEQSRGLRVLGWRTAPTRNDALGEAALATEPQVEQLFVGPREGGARGGGLAARVSEERQGGAMDAEIVHRVFERELFKIVRLATAAAFGDADAYGPLYICSLSGQTMTFKGQLTTAQVRGATARRSATFLVVQTPEIVMRHVISTGEGGHGETVGYFSSGSDARDPDATCHLDR